MTRGYLPTARVRGITAEALCEKIDSLEDTLRDANNTIAVLRTDLNRARWLEALANDEAKAATAKARERVHVVQATRSIDKLTWQTRRDDQDWQSYTRMDLARRLSVCLLEQGFIRFDEGGDALSGWVATTAALNAEHPTKKASDR